MFNNNNYNGSKVNNAMLVGNDDEKRTTSCLPAKFGPVHWAFSLCVVMYGMAFNGFVYGFSSPALPGLLEPAAGGTATPGGGGDNSSSVSSSSAPSPPRLTITDMEASWVSSLTSLGIPIGGLLCGLLTESIGKKWTALVGQTTTFCVGHILIMCAPSVHFIYAGRFICGICQGFCNCLTILYTLVICQGTSTKTKSMAGVGLSLIGNAGTLLTYGLGVVLSWRELAGTLTCLAAPYILGLILIVPSDDKLALMTSSSSTTPTDMRTRTSSSSSSSSTTAETTTTMVKSVVVTVTADEFGSDVMGKSDVINNTIHSKAIPKSLEDIYIQLQPAPITTTTQKTKSWIGSRIDEVVDCLRCSAWWTGLIVMLFYQFGGYNVITFYASTIISANYSAGSQKALMASVLVAVSGIVGVLIGLLLVKTGLTRKIILLISGFGTGFAFIALSLNFHIDDLGHIGENESLWASTIALTLHILLFNLGYGALVYPAIAEIMPLAHRTKYMATITTFGGLFGFVNAKSFVDLKLAFGPIVTFAIYAFINMCGAAYIAIFVPHLP